MAKVLGTEYTVTATKTSLSTILGAAQWVSHIVFRAGGANTGTVYIGPSTLTISANRTVYLTAGESFSISLEEAQVYSDHIYVIGTAGDLLHIFGVS